MEIAVFAVPDFPGPKEWESLMSDQQGSFTDLRPAYKSSWIDRLAKRIDQLPGATWAKYLAMTLFALALLGVIFWAEDNLSPQMLSILAYLTFAIFGLIAFIHFANQRAGRALTSMRPALKIDDAVHKELLYQIQNLPAGRTLLANVLLLAVVAGSELVFGVYAPEGLDSHPTSAALLRIVYYVCWWVFSAFLYHTVHQIRLINKIYTQYTQINLFKMKLLYALSNHSALTAGFLTLVPYGWLLVNPNLSLDQPTVLVFILAITALALVAFFWPQVGIHTLQVAEKDRLLEEANQRIERCLQDLHAAIDSRKLGQVNQIQVTLSSLESELSILNRIRTWPWQPETARWLITALILPLGLWLLQLLLQRLLSG